MSRLALERCSGIPARMLIRYEAEGGFTFLAADRVAVALGVHPASLWPDWFDVSIAETAHLTARTELRQARLSAGLSQADAALAIRIRIRSLSRLEMGTTRPSKEMAARIARFYDRPVAVLFPLDEAA